MKIHYSLVRITIGVTLLIRQHDKIDMHALSILNTTNSTKNIFYSLGIYNKRKNKRLPENLDGPC